MSCSSARRDRHRTTKVRRQQSNGFVERLHRPLLDEHFRIQGRTKWQEVLEEMHQDLDHYLLTYYTKRLHQGRNTLCRLQEGVPQDGEEVPRKTAENTA